MDNLRSTRQNNHQSPPLTMLMIGARFLSKKLFTDRGKKAHSIVKQIHSSHIQSGYCECIHFFCKTCSTPEKGSWFLQDSVQEPLLLSGRTLCMCHITIIIAYWLLPTKQFSVNFLHLKSRVLKFLKNLPQNYVCLLDFRSSSYYYYFVRICE